MARNFAPRDIPVRRIPRRCGDGPSSVVGDGSAVMDSPQVRGWPQERQAADLQLMGFPAGAGMAPQVMSSSYCLSRIPRRCGDGPHGN